MATERELKELVREKYGEIALQSREENASSCCGSGGGCCSGETYDIMAEDYSKLSGYVPDADLGLGCGLPTEFAQIRPGDTVVDLGSGAGNDAFIARSVTGERGHVIGVDMTAPMIEKAVRNAQALGFTNVEFRLGEIENMPVEDGTADVVVSNCVMNLVPDKQKAFAETFRILKPGGHFSISDIVLKGDLPENIRNAAVMYAGCVSGAQQKEEYLRTIGNAGFVNVTVQKEREIHVPDELLVKYISLEEALAYRKSGAGIVSVTVYAEKP